LPDLNTIVFSQNSLQLIHFNPPLAQPLIALNLMFGILALRDNINDNLNDNQSSIIMLKFLHTRLPLVALSISIFFTSTVLAYSPIPGLPPINKQLQQKLEKTVSQKGSDYVPRTQYKDDKNKAKYVNRLILETSPYLQQHAHNPVNWYPWGDDAFEEARRRNIPVLVSIGYSTCHWCHVMEEESYDNEETATFLNQHFIAIKVDREVRPDIDEIYMTALHAMKQRGGWPLNIWLTPDRNPFYGGTYFPPEDAYGRPSFMRVLEGLSTEYQKNPTDTIKFANQLANSIKHFMEGEGQKLAETIASTEKIAAVKKVYENNFDNIWGGLKQTMKFPSSFSNRLLMNYYLRTQEQSALEMINLTLTKMSQGGMHDQIGGGFHRYSTDATWLIPHFEKMLYDNALLATVYIEAWQLTKKPAFKETAQSTLDYILREMTLEDGAFYSATDADSRTTSGEIEEGWYFTWTYTELDKILDKEDAALAKQVFGMTEAGNFEHRNLPQRWNDFTAIAIEFDLTSQQLNDKIDLIKNKLYKIRNKRPPPLRDNKILVSWNGLVISSLAKAGSALNEPKYIIAAETAAKFIEHNLKTDDDRLLRVYQDGNSSGASFLEDYAFFIAGLLDLYEANFNTRWLSLAIALQGQLQNHYSDEIKGGYFRTSDDHEKLIAREKNKNDGALPSGNSVAILNLMRLHHYTLEQQYLDFAIISLKGFTPNLNKTPSQLTEMLLALDYFDDDVKEIVIVHPNNGKRNTELETAVQEAFLPNKILVINTEKEIEDTALLIPMAKGKIAINNISTAYVCYDRICKLPTSDAIVLREQLAKIKPY